MPPTTEETGLRHSRNRRLAGGIATSFAAKAASIFAPLLLIPLALQYMGAAAYAVYLAATALTAMVVFADLGLGQGLMTTVARLLVEDRPAEARRVISTTYVLLAGMAAILSASLVASALAMDWAHVLGVDEASATDSWIAVVCLLGLVVNVPVSLIVRVMYASQHVSTANLWQAIGPGFALAFATTGVALDVGPVALTAGIVAGPVVGGVVASLWFYRRNPHLRPFLARPHRVDVSTVSVLGSAFFILNLVTVVANNIDVILVSHFEVAALVVAFGVATRIFAQLGALVSLVNAPLWPINSEALARGDVAWVRRTTRRMTFASTGVTLSASAVLVIGGQRLLELWTGTPLDLSRWLFVGAGVWWTLLSALSPRFMVQNSVGVIRPQLIGWGAYLLISVPVKIAVLAAVGMQYLPLAAAGLALFTVLPGCLWGYRTAIARNSERVPERAQIVTA